MASERTARAAAAQGAVLLAGGAAAWAVSAGLYASALTAALAGAWLAVVQVEAARGARVRLGRRRAEASALETPLLRALLNEAPAPLLLLEPGGGVRAINRAARTLFGAEDRLARPPAALLQALREDAAGGRRRLALAGGAGPPRLYALSLADVGAPDGGAVRLGALLDVQAEVHAAEADTLRRVLQVMSHELMNALTPVTSLAETAADVLASEPSRAAAEAREALATIGRRAEGLARFVEGYRAAARLPEPRPRAVDLAELVGDEVRLARARPDAAGVAVTVQRPPGALVRVTDPELVARALSNLLTNAVEAAAGAADARVRVGLTPTAGGAVLEVADSGPGVPAGEADSIFMPLTTSKPRGSGVGLHLARAAMRSLGGEVLLVPSASPTDPTTFRIIL